MKFYESRNQLIAKDGHEKDIIFAPRFMQSANQTKAAFWLAEVADKLNEMAPYSDEMAGYLQVCESKLNAALTAEKFLEEVEF